MSDRLCDAYLSGGKVQRAFQNLNVIWIFVALREKLPTELEAARPALLSMGGGQSPACTRDTREDWLCRLDYREVIASGASKRLGSENRV